LGSAPAAHAGEQHLLSHGNDGHHGAAHGLHDIWAECREIEGRDLEHMTARSCQSGPCPGSGKGRAVDLALRHANGCPKRRCIELRPAMSGWSRCSPSYCCSPHPEGRSTVGLARGSSKGIGRAGRSGSVSTRHMVDFSAQAWWTSDGGLAGLVQKARLGGNTGRGGGGFGGS
jgi:hypothetical protein